MHKHELANSRLSLVGGALMVAVGIFYLIFQKELLGKAKLAGDSTAPANDFVSRILLGVQVCNEAMFSLGTG